MKNKVKLTNEEKGLCNLFRRLGYGSRSYPDNVKAFTSEHLELIKEAEPSYQQGYPSQKALLFSHYKDYFVNADEEYYPFTVKSKFSDDEFIKQAKRACRRITKIFVTDKFVLEHSWVNKNYILLIIYVLRKGSKVGIHKLIKPDERSIEYLAAIYLDKKNQKICIHHIPPKIVYYFNLILQEETNTNFVPSMRHKDIAWNLFTQKLLTAQNLELVEIGLNKTDFATGDQIIIKPKDNDAREYLKALLDQKKIINSDTFNLSYIDYIKVRRKNGKYNLIKLHYADDGIVPKIMSSNKDANLIKDLESLGFPVGVKIVDTNKIPKKSLIQELLMSCCISKDELKNNNYLAVINYMDSVGLIKDKVDKNLYLCFKTKKCKGSFFLVKTCPTCGNNQTIKVPNGMKFNFNLDKVRNDLKNKLMKHKIKYRRLKKAFYDNKFELQKAQSTNLPQINIYFNLTGLYEPVLNNFMLCPLPLLVVNFRGEMKNDLKFIHQIDAADFIEALYDTDDNKTIEIIKKAAEDTKYGEKKETAFQNSLKTLRDFKKNSTLLINSRKGNEFEWLTFNVFSYLFHVSEKWGGKSLPDGIIGFNSDDKKFAFWDAKRYDNTKLSNYAKKRKGGIGKDIKYVLKSISQEDTYEEGKLGYYIFVTSHTSKEDFMKLQETLNKKIEKEKDRTDLFKKLKSIKFCCLNIDELIKLGSVIEDKKDYEVLKRKDTEFENSFEALLNTNDGYVSTAEIEKLIEPLTKEKVFVPNKTTHKIN